jgi:hypothetical protein
MAALGWLHPINAMIEVGRKLPNATVLRSHRQLSRMVNAYCQS